MVGYALGDSWFLNGFIDSLVEDIVRSLTMNVMRPAVVTQVSPVDMDDGQ